jgi:hypothetical protein
VCTWFAGVCPYLQPHLFTPYVATSHLFQQNAHVLSKQKQQYALQHFYAYARLQLQKKFCNRVRKNPLLHMQSLM